MLIREGTAADARACAAIYAPYVRDTAISFESEPPDAAELERRIAAARAWLVADADGAAIGYAYAVPFAPRPAYRWSCEVSVYIGRTHRRLGAGRALYTALLDRLARHGYLTAVAKITLPNEASIGLHEALGFQPVGVHRGIGYKAGRWHDVAVLQRQLAALPPEPAEPR